MLYLNILLKWQHPWPLTFDFCLQARLWGSAGVPGVIGVSPSVRLVRVMVKARGVFASLTADRRVQKQTGPCEASRALQTEIGTTGVTIHLSKLITSPRIHSSIFGHCLVHFLTLIGIISSFYVHLGNFVFYILIHLKRELLRTTFYNGISY